MSKQSKICLMVARLLLTLIILTSVYSQGAEDTCPVITEKDLFNIIPVLKNSADLVREVNREFKYEFTNLALAYKILTRLDVFVPVPQKALNANQAPKYDKPFLGLINDPEYCDNNRAMFIQRPDVVFLQKNIFVETRAHTLSKSINEIGTDIMPRVGSHMPKARKNRFQFELRTDITSFFSSRSMHSNMHLGQHFGCLAQEVNHIPGHFDLKRKDLVAVSARKYVKKYRSRPECLSPGQYFPKTWLLHDEKSCKDFFAQLDTAKHRKLQKKNHIVYIKKIVNSHRGLGVTALNPNKEKLLVQEYDNGTLCGTTKKAIIIQNYISNILLLENRKFDFRLYLLISSTNPLIAYYHDGFLRVSLYDYDPKANNKVLLTNMALNKDIYKKIQQGDLYQGMDENELRDTQQWTFARFQKYLLSKGIISDPNWLNNYLRPEFKKAMTHLVRMTSKNFIKRSSVYELYGVDFILDNDMKLWFIEANSGPTLNKYSSEVGTVISQMIKDHFEIVYGLLRSRMKRVMGFVNKIIQNDGVFQKKNGNIVIRHLIKIRKEFKEIIKNYFEPEFQPSAHNTFIKIVDESLEGVARYQGVLSEQCL